MVIQHNMSALNANRQLGITSGQKAASTEKLSSGYKINRSADDAAGLSISEKMRKQIRGLDRGAANIEDGISYAQIADGALNEVHDMLQRMNELAVQAANGTNSATDREYIDNEIQLLKAEMERVFTTTSFHEKKIWEGDNPIDQKEIVGIKTVQALNINTTSSSRTVAVNNENYEYLPRTTFQLRATEDDGVWVEWTAYNGIQYTSKHVSWDEFADQKYKLTADSLLSEVTYTDPDDGAAKTEALYDSSGNPMFDFRIVCTDVASTATPAQLAQALDSVPISISTYSASLDPESDHLTAKGIYMSASINFPAAVYDKIAAQNAVPPKEGWDFLDSTDADFSFKTASNFVNNDGVYEFHFEMEGLGPVTAKFSSLSSTCPSDISSMISSYQEYYRDGYYYTNRIPQAGDELFEKYSGWYSTTTLNTPYRAPNGQTYQYRISARSGPSATGKTEEAIESALTDSTRGLLTIANGGSTKSGGSSMSFYFSLTTDETITPPGDKLTVGSMTLSGIRITASDTVSTVLQKVQDALNNKDTTINIPGRASSHSYSYRVASQNPSDAQAYDYNMSSYYDDLNLNIHSGSETTDKISLDYECLRISTIGLTGTNVLTEENALAAIDEVASALEMVSAQRSLFGAYQNRMEHAQSIDQNSSENTQSAESKIRDTDMAKEMVNYSNLNILGQAGQSMLAQANQKNQGILNLIQ